MNISNYSPSRESFFEQKWTKRQLWTIRVGMGATVGFLVAGIFFWNYPFASAETLPTPKAQPLPVEVVSVESQGSYAAQRTYTGVLVAAKTSELSFELPGKIIQLSVDEGDHVQAGQALAVLDDRHLSARIAQTKAEHDQQLAILEELKAGPRSEVIAAAEAEVRQLDAELQLQQANKKRREQLIQRSAISRETLEDAVFGAEAAQGRLDAAKSRLEELCRGTRIEQIDAQKARVAGLEAQLVDLQHEQEDTRLVAPFSGTIARRNFDEGAVISAGQSVYRIVQHEPLEVWLGLPPEAATTLSLGDVLPVTVNDQTRQGKVTGIVPELDATTRTQTVVLRLDEEASRGWVPAQVARVSLASERNDNGFWLPNSALLQGSRGLWSVYVVNEEHRVSRREIEVIYSESERSFVRGTLTSGERVVASGVNRLVPEMQVSIQTANEPLN
ncbi:efflux transporter periplasmic adaptor subunit [Blastopirellula marina]|uniref:Efflux transporter periplasmic adaptor subunit n=1 Tax=Blastopirellula marina TaxID=124 RepID=A0A2S8EYH6_9BACT|nr:MULTISPECIES: efflux RND transporter periplasmic adaptor subunit [Pirellulaceae]PQO24976.1 efflux transporter periplasmic adaptor subunit [Blastopirellula marina]RCS40828.1 efflux RND transporter periplasmic adaptor subunit [Bremerella cremea]